MGTSYEDRNRSLLKSTRGIPLVYQPTEAKCRPVVTCENYLKHYWIFVVNPDGSVEPAEDGLHQFLSKYPDGQSHTFNPEAIEEWANSKGYWLDDCSMEIICHRFITGDDCSRH